MQDTTKFFLCPYPKPAELYHEAKQPDPNKQNDKEPYDHIDPALRLPGHPYIRTTSAWALQPFLTEDLITSDLDKMAPHLWIMSTQSSDNIWPLHAQKVQGREIVVTEDPGLHLVWYYERVFIKPIPKYLLSYDFWYNELIVSKSPITMMEEARESLARAALGFLRTYYYLIKHESDFHLAKTEALRLIPPETTWDEWCQFRFQLNSIEDSEVSPRYHYGHLRLSRLNFYIKILLRKLHYRQLDGQYAAYFARFFGPLLFLFGVLSVLLSAMQLEMAVESLTSVQWVNVWSACRWFAVICIFWLAAVAFVLVALLAHKIADEWAFALRMQLKRRRESWSRPANKVLQE